MDLQLAGKKVVISGATRGIGLAIAKAFAKEGRDVAICARDSAGVTDAVAALKQSNVNAAGEARRLDNAQVPANMKALIGTGPDALDWVREAVEHVGKRGQCATDRRLTSASSSNAVIA